MTYENSALKYIECDVCGQKKQCFTQYEFDGKHVLCSDCLLITDLD